MAPILPNTPIGKSPPETLRVYHLLRRLPDNDFVVWQRLSYTDEPGPDFWVLRRDQCALLLKVSGATPAEVKAALQPTLFGAGSVSAPIGRQEQDALRHFAARLSRAGQGPLIPAAILFANLSASVLARVTAANRPPDLIWAGKERLAHDSFPDWLAGHLSHPLADETVVALRLAFTPEVVIPPSFTVRQPIERHTAAGLTEHLLDYRQEFLLKSDLDLTAEAHSTARDFGVRLINGVAGSGKSLIIVYRALLLRRLFAQRKVLVLTHNRPLIRDLQTRYLKLSDGDRSVQWYTFLGWCRRFWPAGDSWQKTIGSDRRMRLIRDAWHAHLADTAVTEQMLREEIDWFKDRPLFGRHDYLTADRTGRGFALSEPMRHRVYEAMDAYHQALYALEMQDWGDVPRRLWRLIHSGQFRPPTYDAILIDEAQFFAPIWFEIVKQLLKPITGHVFLVADPSQGFLRRRQSWLSSGLEVRGRAHRLYKSYRTTRQILDFATLLYRTRLPEDDESEEIVTPNLLDMPTGALPVVIPLTSPQDEVTRVVNEIRQILRAGVPRSDILVIHANSRETDNLIARLQKEFGEQAAVDPGQVIDVIGNKEVGGIILDHVDL